MFTEDFTYIFILKSISGSHFYDFYKWGQTCTLQKKSIIFEEIRDFLQFLSICYSLKHTNLCHELQVLNKYHKIFISWKCIYIQHGLNSSLFAVNTLCKMKTFYQNRKPFCRTGSSVFFSAENKLSQTLQKVQNKVMSRNYASFS